MWQQMKGDEDRAASSPSTEVTLVSLFFILKISICELYSYGIPSEHLLRIIHTKATEKFTKLMK